MSRSNRSDRRRRRSNRRPEAEKPTPQPAATDLPPEPAAYPSSFPPEPLSERRAERGWPATTSRLQPSMALTDEEIEGELRAGCPMLTRTKMALPGVGHRHVPRCSLAWAVHSDAEAAFCLLTEDLVDCWKAHPERVPALESLIAAEASAAD